MQTHVKLLVHLVLRKKQMFNFVYSLVGIKLVYNIFDTFNVLHLMLRGTLILITDVKQGKN